MARPQSYAKAELVRRGIRQKTVAERYGTSQAFVSEILCGRKPPPERFRLLVSQLVLGDALGDEVADRLLEAVRAAGEQGLDGSEQRDLFSRHAGGKRLEMARALLEGKGLIVTEDEETGGRPRLVSRAAKR